MGLGKSQNGINLAVNLITDHFGAIVAKVCECLLRRGSLMMQECLRYTELSPSQVKSSLLVLIQHNCVQAFSIPRPVGMGTLTKYMVIFDNVIHRLRFAKFVNVVRKDLGSECETLLEGLLQNGRLTFDQLVDFATSKQAEATKDALHLDFNRLVQSRYVERCPRAEPFLTPTEDDTASKRGSKVLAGSLSTEQQAIVAAKLLDAERFSEITDVEVNKIFDGKNTKPYTETSVGEKRKHGALEVENEVQAENTEEILWRANFEKFIHCLKKKTCIEATRARNSLDAGLVLEALIESSGQERANNKNHVKSSLDNIVENLMGRPEGRSMTRDRIRPILDQIGCSLLNEQSGSQYSIDLGKIIQDCQHDEIDAIVQKRYGQETYRVFRLLAVTGKPCETDRIADKTMLEKKVAQEILFKLWEDSYLDMQKIQLGGVHNLLCLWKVKTDALREHILNDVCHAALNLRLKIAHIVEQIHEVLQVEKLGKLKTCRSTLEASLLRLDDILMLFHDFA